jgi:hypothetical protein
MTDKVFYNDIMSLVMLPLALPLKVAPRPHDAVTDLLVQLTESLHVMLLAWVLQQEPHFHR